MSGQKYNNQVKLLLRILPYVAEERCFALHGGTAINLFIRDMPRLSVDIDLTYLPIEDRDKTSNNIKTALENIKTRIQGTLSNTQILNKSSDGKIFICSNSDEIKLEVNLVARGTIEKPKKMMLRDKVQDDYETSAVMQIVPFGQVYGGKICAALDRQHPRDLFDIKILLENEGFSDDVREGFLLCLISSPRSINDMLAPNFKDQRRAMDNQFAGMSPIEFIYDDFERTREQLIQTIHQNLTDSDKQFLLSVKNCEPDWRIYDFERFPAVQWKLQHLAKLKESNSDKHKQLYEKLKKTLNTPSF